jgi:hypothetical protein
VDDDLLTSLALLGAGTVLLWLLWELLSVPAAVRQAAAAEQRERLAQAADRDRWRVLDEARRITRDAAESS